MVSIGMLEFDDKWCILGNMSLIVIIVLDWLHFELKFTN
jgi:hypothetical protein